MREILHDTLAILHPAERRKLFRLTFFDVAVSVLDIFFLTLLLGCIQLYADPAFASRHRWIPAAFNVRHSLWPVAIVCICIGIKNWIAYLVYERQCHFRFDLSLRLSAQNMQVYLDGAFQPFIDTDSSVHAGRISQQPIELCQHVLEGWQQAVREITLIVFAVIACIAFNAVLFLLLIVVLAPPLLLVARFSKRKLHTVRTQMKTARDKTWQHVHESIAAFVESNLYHRSDFFTDRYARAQKTLNDQLSTLRAMQAIPARISEWFAVAGLLILLWLGPYFASGVNSYITLGAFLAAAYKIIPGVSRVQHLLSVIRTYAFTVKGMASQTSAVPVPANEVLPIQSIRFHRSRFQHAGQPQTPPFSAMLTAGDFILLRGDSGSGKTTLINGLLGFMEPLSGSIVINEQAVSAAERKRYWPQIAYVSQSPFIFHDSLLQNITLGDDAPDLQQVARVLSVTGLDRMVSESAEGLSLTLAGQGKNISGGQRQRVALARALYKKSDVLILDEPFNELDLVAELRLLEHLKKLSEAGSIILLVSHHDRCLSFCTKSFTVDPVTHSLIPL